MLRALLMNVSKNFARYEILVEDVTPAAAIQKVVGRLNPDLLVLGTHGRGRMGACAARERFEANTGYRAV